jgi:CheY-like chemotaxis protein/anti-sigma regulatory factor (Ser/Thr protein kinase)
VFWRRDGSSFPVEYLVAPMRDSEERITGVTLTFRDTTERRAVEKMKDEFVSTVSHELRTPLTSIRGALGLLNSGMLGVTNEKAARMLQIAVSNTDRLVRLINDILDLERIDSGRIELIRKDADALHLMTQTVDGVATMAQQARVAIVVEPVVASVWLDWDRVTQTLTNLVSNAVKFSPAGSTVTIGGSTADDGTFTFRVSDQGRGVPEEKLEMIFERFKQVDASDSRDKGGTGLGLAICRSIVTAHGGRIWAQRNQPCGTLFQFTIPPKPNEAGEVTSSRTVLVCHDEVTRTDAVSAILEQNHFQIVDVPSPADLIDRAAAVQPDAIVLDLASAPSDAWRIIDKLQESETTRHVPVIVAVGDAPLSGETCANGIAKWVRAPLPNEELIDAVEEACRGPLILIVEDDADLARVMAESLHSRGIRTLHALDGQRAVELCREHNPTLVVLDLILPRMDGFAVVEELRHDSSRRSLPLLVYSALEVNQAEQDRLRLGPTEFLTKSRCSLQEFEVHVVKLLNTVAKEEREHAA